MSDTETLDTIREFEHDGTTYKMTDPTVLEEQGLCELDRLPVSIRILLRFVLRNVDGDIVTEEDMRNATPQEPDVPNVEVPSTPSRVVLQDLTGVSVVVDLAALRSAADRVGEDPKLVEPEVLCDLAIDHSVQVGLFGTPDACEKNVEPEYERSAKRYKALKWVQNALDNFSVVPPGTSIVHQVDLEYPGWIVRDRERCGDRWLLPDTLVGTDSHTSMISGIDAVGWGIGGIEVETAMLGQPIMMKLPEVVGVRLDDELPEGTTATDLMLHVTEQLREVGVVDRFVEFFGPGVGNLSVPDRVTTSNIAPEQGSTISAFLVDEATLDYLELTDREPEHIELAREYLESQGLFGEQHPEYTETVDVDLSVVGPSLAGPKRPQDRVTMSDMKTHFRNLLYGEFKDDVADTDEEATVCWLGEGGDGSGDGKFVGDDETLTETSEAALEEPDLGGLTKRAEADLGGETVEIDHGSVVASAITSCTNILNSSVMIVAGLLTRDTLEKGLDAPEYAGTSSASGSRIVTEYLKKAGLFSHLGALGYDVAGYGCTTCTGNARSLPELIESAIDEHGLWTTSAPSGNRNFEARTHPKVRVNYLASPPLVVTYGLAGRVDIDLEADPLGVDDDGSVVYLADIWPDADEIRETIHDSVDPSVFHEKYAEVLEGDKRWEALEAPTDDAYDWDDESTYTHEPPFFTDFLLEKPGVSDIEDARCLLMSGSTVTTDHTSPAGPFGSKFPTGQWLVDNGVDPVDFNTYGSRCGNHGVMMRGTFVNVRIENQMPDDVEGGYTVHHPSDEEATVFEASQRYREEGTPLVALSGVEFGIGSSRDWAAKGTGLLGVRTTIAENHERIYRNNLVGMDALPLQFENDDSQELLGLDGPEQFDIRGLDDGLDVNDELTVVATKDDGTEIEFDATAQVGAPVAVTYVKHNGILHYMLRRFLIENRHREAISGLHRGVESGN